MMTHTIKKLALLSALYFSQGLPFGFFTQALPVFLRQQDLSLTAISLTSLLSLPWALKFLWAPWVDKLGAERADHRHRWILPLQYMAALTMFGISWLEPKSHLPLILAATLLTNMLAATQDIATDGLAVDSLEPHERGLGNGVQVAGYRVGMIVGGGLLLIIYDSLKWRGTFLCLSALLLVATLPIALSKPKRRAARSTNPTARPATLRAALEPLRLIPQFFKRPGMGWWAAVLIIYKLGDAMAGGMLRPWLVDRGLGTDEIGWLLGTAGFSAGLIGALVGGGALSLLGRTRALTLFGLAQTLGVGSYFLVAATGRMDLLSAACLLEHFTGGLATAALFTCMMDRCQPDSSATDYTIMASVVVMATGLGQALSGLSATALGYANHFAASAIISLLGVLASYWILQRQRHEPSPI